MTEHINPLTLPRAVDGLGYIYVIRFSTGLVKVGMTKNPYVRFAGYRTQLAPHDIHVEWCWISAAHADYLLTESGAIRAAQLEATDTRHSEYFLGADAEAVVATIETWRPDLVPTPVAATSEKAAPVELKDDESARYKYRLRSSRLVRERVA